MWRQESRPERLGGRALLCLLAGAAGYLAFSYPETLNLPPDADPRLGTPPPTAVERPARRVVWVLVDGLRLDASRRMEGLNRLRAEGMDVEARAEFPTFSLTNFIVQASGLDPEASGVRVNGHHREVSIDSVFRRAKLAGLRTAVTSTDDSSYGRPYGSWVDEDRLAEHSEELPEGGLVLVHLDGVDEAGHRSGGASRRYARAVREADAILEAIAVRLDPRRDALIVTSDHGHTDRGGHGGMEPEVIAIPIVLWGAGVPVGTRQVGASGRDVGPTIATLLDLAPLQHATGRSLVGEATADATTGRGAILHCAPGLRPYIFPGSALLASIALTVMAYRSHVGRRAWLVSPTYTLSFAGLYWSADTLSFSTVNDAQDFGLRLLGMGMVAGVAQLLVGSRLSLAPATVVTSLAALTALVAAPGPTPRLPSAELCFLPIPALAALAIACCWMAATRTARPPHE
jgi:hypothetical protein